VLCSVLMVKLIFQPRVHPLVTMMRLGVIASAAFLILMMGSRGALVGIVLGAAVVVAISIKRLHPQFFNVRVMSVLVMVTLAMVLAIVLSPWFQDNSTYQRGTIISNIWTMQGLEPVQGMIGFGSYTSFAEQAEWYFPNALMDPHNLIIEISVWYGIPAMIGFILVWLVVAYRGLWRQWIDGDWRAIAALVVTILYPVLGVVPSSTLRYHVVWLWLIATLTYMMCRRLRVAEARHESRIIGLERSAALVE